MCVSLRRTLGIHALTRVGDGQITRNPTIPRIREEEGTRYSSEDDVCRDPTFVIHQYVHPHTLVSY